MSTALFILSVFLIICIAILAASGPVWVTLLTALLGGAWCACSLSDEDSEEE